MKFHILLHPKFIDMLENDGKTQARFHQFMAYAWLAAMVLVPFVPAFGYAQHLGLLLLMEISLYANFATEYGALSAAQSSMRVGATIEHADVVNF